MGFGEGGDAVFAFGEVIQGSEEEHRIDGMGFTRKRAGIALADSSEVEAAGLFNVFGDRIEEIDGVTQAGEPCGVEAGAAADVEDR